MRLRIVSLCLLFVGSSAFAQIDAGFVQKVLPGMDHYLATGRYMTDGKCTFFVDIDEPIQKNAFDQLYSASSPDLLQNLRRWKGFNLQACRYQVANPDGRRISTFVVMANPEKKVLSDWLASACNFARGLSVYKNLAAESCIKKLYTEMQLFSSIQLPIFGDVMEDIDVASDPNQRRQEQGYFKHFCFQNGVTMVVQDNIGYNGSVSDAGEVGLKNCMEKPVIAMKTGRARLVGTLPEHLESYLHLAQGSLQNPTTWMQTLEPILKTSLSQSEKGSILLNAWIASDIGQSELLH